MTGEGTGMGADLGDSEVWGKHGLALCVVRGDGLRESTGKPSDNSTALRPQPLRKGRPLGRGGFCPQGLLGTAPGVITVVTRPRSATPPLPASGFPGAACPVGSLATPPGV